MMQKDCRQELLEQTRARIMIEGRYLQYTQDMQMHIITCMENTRGYK